MDASELPKADAHSIEKVMSGLDFYRFLGSVECISALYGPYEAGQQLKTERG